MTPDDAPVHDSAIAQLPALARELRRVLDDLRHALDAEIRDYPTPIPRCDAQFNFLYDQRQRIAAQLAALDAAGAEETAYRHALAEVLAAPPVSERPDERALRTRIAAGFAAEAVATGGNPAAREPAP